MGCDDLPMASTERQAWMVEAIDVGADDVVLELGHGHGVAASAICERLAKGRGRYVGVDRSATMTEAASRRLASHIEEGRAELVTADVTGAVLAGPFDVVVAIHFPPVDRGDPGPTLAALAPHLTEEGRLCVGFQPLAVDQVDAGVERLERLVPEHGFAVVDVRRGSPDGRPAAVVVASFDGPA